MYIPNLETFSHIFYLIFVTLEKYINNVPSGITLRLRRICYSDEKCSAHTTEYKNYLIARDYKPSLVDKQSDKVSKISRTH